MFLKNKIIMFLCTCFKKFRNIRKSRDWALQRRHARQNSLWMFNKNNQYHCQMNMCNNDVADRLVANEVSGVDQLYVKCYEYFKMEWSSFRLLLTPTSVTKMFGINHSFTPVCTILLQIFIVLNETDVIATMWPRCCVRECTVPRR